MLNSALVEYFHSVHRQRRSGVLHAQGTRWRIRFLFEGGEPMAMDLGCDKQTAIANTLLTYNRLPADLHQQVVAQLREGRVTAAEAVRATGAASEAEIDSCTRGLIEDVLVEIFSDVKVDLGFEPDVDAGDFDFDRTAVKLRIDTEVLLRTADQRVKELEAAQQVVPPNAVFALAEAGDAQPSDGERAILDRVDGLKQVEQIAMECRDSVGRLQRQFHGLLNKGLVRRLAGSTTRLRPGTAAAAAPAEPQLYRAPRERTTRSPLVLAGLGVALTGAVGLWFLVKDYDSKQRELEGQSARLTEMLTQRQWREAEVLLSDLRAAAVGDVQRQRRIDQMSALIEGGVGAELHGVSAAIDRRQYVEARARLEAMTDRSEVKELRARLDAEDSANRATIARLAAEVTSAIAKDDLAGALAVVDANPGPEGAAAVEAIDRWRMARLDELGSPGAPMVRRLATLDRLAAARPNAWQVSRMEQARADLQRQQARLHETLAAQVARAEAGEPEAAAEEIRRLRLAETAEGTPLAVSVADALARCQKLQEGLDTARGQFLSGLRGGADAAVLKTSLDAVRAQATRVAGTAAGIGLATLVDGGTRILEVLDSPADGRLDRLSAMTAADSGLDAVLVEALAARVAALAQVDAAITVELDLAQRLARDGDPAAAVHRLEVVLARPELAGAARRPEAVIMLEEVQANLVKQSRLQAELLAALARGEVAHAQDLGRQMGLKYLPMVIESRPPGAQVRQGETMLGVTPLALNLPAAEREDWLAEVTLPGYKVATATGARADGGWRLVLELERDAVASATLARPMTSHPAVINGKVYLADRFGAVAIAPDASLTVVPFDQPGQPAALNEPLYAPAAGDGQAALLGTREGVALRLSADGRVERLAMAGRSDLAVAVFRSQLLLDRPTLIVADRDGRLVASDQRAEILWRTAAGSPFAVAPVVVGELVAALRRDGDITAWQAYDGVAAGRWATSSAVLSAWTVADGFAGITADGAFHWTLAGLSQETLPIAPATAGPGVVIGTTGRVLVQADNGWTDLGHLEDRPAGQPIAWAGHAVVPLADRVRVVGPRGFTVATGGEPGVAVVGGRLVVVSATGRVLVYEP